MVHRWLECVIEQREVFPRLFSVEFMELWQEPGFRDARRRLGQPVFTEVR